MSDPLRNQPAAGGRPVRLGLLNGSLAARSANGAALEVARRHLVERRGVEVDTAADIGALPLFRPEQVEAPPAAVAAFQRTIGSLDAVLLAGPEYAGGLSGPMKNALDWLVGAATLYHTPVGVLSAGSTGGAYAIEQLVRSVSWQGGLVVATLAVAAPNTKMDTEGRFVDPATLEAIAAWADLVLLAVSGSVADRRRLLTETVTAYGIDPARLGELD